MDPPTVPTAVSTPSVTAFQLRMEQLVQAAVSNSMGSLMSAVDARIQAAMAPLTPHTTPIAGTSAGHNFRFDLSL